MIGEILDRDRTKLAVRLVAVAVVVTAGGLLATAYADRNDSERGPTAGTTVGDSIAPPRNGTTVVAMQGLNPEEVPPAAVSEPNGALLAIGPDGEVVYWNTTYHTYWDVDPVEGTEATVVYVAGEVLPASECGTESTCYVNRVERVNFTTGDHTVLHTDVANGDRWHDVDRYDDDSILVADKSDDRVVVINTTSGLVEWGWDADDEFSPGSGGDFDPSPASWTHINDVELLPDGRILADLRNQDAVVFLDPHHGLQETWTLGGDDNHSTLYEQHNPDYIPEARGGPALLVADSENDRIVEYQRVDGGWELSWVYQTPSMNWPRDADRLPNGHTLVTDTNTDRVFELDEEGAVVWRVNVERPYEAERLETGDESAGGSSAASLGLPSRTLDENAQDGTSLEGIVTGLVPSTVIDAVVFVTPRWMGFYHVGLSLATVGVLLTWALLEFYWSSFVVELRWPVRLRRD
jgi:hypothetical protein